MLIEIVSDAVCPWCYIGKRRIEQAFALDPDPTRRVVWRPFQLNPDMPPEGMDRRAYLRAKFGDDPKQPRIFGTSHGEGYVFTAPLS